MVHNTPPPIKHSIRRWIVLTLSLLLVVAGMKLFTTRSHKTVQVPIVAEVTNEHNHMVHQSAMGIVDGRGNPILLNGVNLGSWLQWESYIFGGNLFSTQTDILNGLINLVGEQHTRQFQQDVYRRFITEDDIRAIALLGFNTVRVPINYQLLE